MRKVFLSAALALLVGVTGAAAAQISGNYIEARTAEVYVGACFANSQTNLTGQEAVMGWQVTGGSWNGVGLDGLAVAGVVRANATLGTGRNIASQTTSLVIVDERANASQSQALVEFVKAQSPDLFANVKHVERAAIRFETSGTNGGHNHDMHGPAARLVVGDMAQIVTRAINHQHDATCANAEIYYEPLASVQAEPAMAVTHEFRGAGLGATWKQSNRTSAFVGTFER